jgi:hypothetical protein
MQEIEKTNNFITYDGFVYDYLGFDKIDEMCVHLSIMPLWYDSDGSYEIIGLLGGSTKVNGVLKNTSQEIIDSL